MNEHASTALERPFAINGDLTVEWSRDTTIDGWRSWVPWPHVSANDIVIGNPSFIEKRDGNDELASVKKLVFSVNSPELFDGKIVIPALVLDTPVLHLRREASGKDNWIFSPNDKPSAWSLELGRLVINDGAMQLDDAIRKANLKGEISTVDDGSADGYGLNWTIKGSYNGEKLDANGKAGAVLALKDQSKPYPLQASVHAGKTRITIKGTLTKPSDLAALDLRLYLSSASMADLYPLTGITLPDTPAFNTEGHLIGKLNRQGGNWAYENFKGQFGSSDLFGTLAYQSKGQSNMPRPLLSGTVESNLLQFRDLAPIIGGNANPKRGNTESNAAAVQQADRVLPSEAFKFDRWRSIDADVRFTGKKIIRDKNLPIDNLVTHIVLRDGVLSLLPLQFGVAGGKLVSNIKLDGTGSKINATLDTSIEHFQLNQLAPNFKPMQSSFGEINGRAKLSGTGNSVATLLGTSSGEISALISQGKVSKLLLDELGLNVVNILFAKMFGDKQIQINCVATDLTVSNGLAQFKDFLVDTDEVIVNASGQMDLANEKLALTISPTNKKFRLVSLRSPIYVGGTFKNPAIDIDKKTVALRTGGAIALGVLTPFAALLPLVDTGPAKDSECANLLHEMQAKPQLIPAPKKPNASVAGAKVSAR